MTVHYKNKKISRAVLAGIFLTAAGLLWGIRDVSAGTEVEVEGQAAGGVFFYDTETELNIYLTRNLYFKYGY
ncbi:MAG: hypothetical protein KKH28_07650, partial [Elusimicrobia bacterium]|nr:hypothetical protein [Elusimicrobiota bacterium]